MDDPEEGEIISSHQSVSNTHTSNIVLHHTIHSQFDNVARHHNKRQRITSPVKTVSIQHDFNKQTSQYPSGLESENCLFGAYVLHSDQLEAAVESEFKKTLLEHEVQYKKEKLEKSKQTILDKIYDIKQDCLNRTRQNKQLQQLEAELHKIEQDLKSIDEKIATFTSINIQPTSLVNNAERSDFEFSVEDIFNNTNQNDADADVFQKKTLVHSHETTTVETIPVQLIEPQFSALKRDCVPSEIHYNKQFIGFVDDSIDISFSQRIVQWLDGGSDWFTERSEDTAHHLSDHHIPISELDLSSHNWESILYQTLNQKLAQTPVHEVQDHLVIPLELWNTLYPHQKDCFPFFWSLHHEHTGGILGDEMGLGKTLQIVAFLGALHFTTIVSQIQPSMSISYPITIMDNSETMIDQKNHMESSDSEQLLQKGTLIICPATVVPQWVKEFHYWYPPLRCHSINGKNYKERRKIIKSASKFGQLLILSYETARAEIEYIHQLPWSYVILDEGQKIRNPEAAITIAVKRILTRHRLLLSGSPIQNNLRELWSLFDFVVPGRLGLLSTFIEHFVNPIRLGGLNSSSRSAALTAYNTASALRELIMPHFLRRSKKELQDIVQLPSKSEQVLFCHLSPIQFRIYVDFLESQNLPINQNMSRLSTRSSIVPDTGQIFFALSILRKICNHPDLLLLHAPDHGITDFGAPERSGKIQVALNVLKSWRDEGHRALIFSQTLQILNILEFLLTRDKYSFRRIDGKVSLVKRQAILEEFNEDKSIFLLLLTTRVGGVGLNLTAANRVLIFDPDWNPMTDVQARERSWRIGQTKDVVIYRLICGGTIEEKIYHRQLYKQFLSRKILDDPRQKRYFKLNDLQELFQRPPCPPSLPDGSNTLINPVDKHYRKILGQLFEHYNLDTIQQTILTDKQQLERDILANDCVSQNTDIYAVHTDTNNNKTEAEDLNNSVLIKDTIGIRIPKKESQQQVPSRSVIKKKGRFRKKESSTCNTDTYLKCNYIETEITGLQALGPYVENTTLAPDISNNNNKILNTLLEKEGIQGSVSHDFFELSHPDFDLDHRQALENTARAVHAITGKSCFNSGSSTPKNIMELNSNFNLGISKDGKHVHSDQISLLQLLREKAAPVLEKTTDSSVTYSDMSQWNVLIEEQLRTFMKTFINLECTTSDILEKFNPIVSAEKVKEIEFKRVLKKNCKFNSNTRTWRLIL